MKCVFVLSILFVQRVLLENFTEETVFQWNETTTEENLDLTTEQNLKLTTGENFDLTAEEILDLTTEEIVESTTGENLELTAEESLELTAEESLELIAEENLELTTSVFLNSNSTNNTIKFVIPEIVVSPLVTEILREIFRIYESYCWRRSYGRGVGRPLHTCPEHASEQYGLLCYPPCRYGYNGVGPMCWEKCDNLTSFGLICWDVRLSQRHSCPWYDKCGLFKSSCVLCAANYTKLGCLCGRFSVRSSYGRGVGTPLVCTEKYEQDGALCYNKCDENYDGIGPVCWQNCPISHPYSCIAGCAKTKEICHSSVKKMVDSVISSAIQILKTVIGIPFVSSTTLDIFAYATKGEWILVLKGIAILAGLLMEKILPDLANKFVDRSSGELESATKNASLILTVAALNDNILSPILKYFHLDAVYSAFNYGKCDFN